jgi:hypothetical protein
MLRSLRLIARLMLAAGAPGVCARSQKKPPSSFSGPVDSSPAELGTPLAATHANRRRRPVHLPPGFPITSSSSTTVPTWWLASRALILSRSMCPLGRPAASAPHALHQICTWYSVATASPSSSRRSHDPLSPCSGRKASRCNQPRRKRKARLAAPAGARVGPRWASDVALWELGKRASGALSTLHDQDRLMTSV